MTAHKNSVELSKEDKTKRNQQRRLREPQAKRSRRNRLKALRQISKGSEIFDPDYTREL